MINLRRIHCDNCSAPYNIDIDKLTKEKNKITCRRCQHKIIIYKSKLAEPQDEETLVNQDDEKTLVDENPDKSSENLSVEPNIQQSMPNISTAISSTPPPLSLKRASSLADTQPPLQSPSTTDDLSDPTIRRPSFAQVEEKVPSKKSATSNNPYTKMEQELAQKPKNAPTPTTAPRSESFLQICAGLMIIALLGSFAQYAMQDPMMSIGALLVSNISLLMGVLLLVTSNFGAQQPKMPLTIGISAVLTGVIAAGVLGYQGDINMEEMEHEPTIAEVDKSDADGQRTDEVVASQDNEKNNNGEIEKSTKNDGNSPKANGRSNSASNVNERSANERNSESQSSNSRNSSNSSNNSSNSQNKSPNLEPSMEPEAMETKVVKPIANPDRNSGSSADLAFDPDLDLDADEDDKKGLFSSRKEDEKPKEPPKPVTTKPTEDIKVNIPSSVLDTIIRNNQSVKQCYMDLHKATGSVPSSVNIMFTLESTGKVQRTDLADGPYVATKFESCLRSAFKTMTFPPFDSRAKPQQIRYTLKLG